MDEIRGAVLAATEAIVPLLADDRVATRWSEPSALPGFSVGGLAGHLARGAEVIESYLDEPEPPNEDLVDPVRYFGAGLAGGGGGDEGKGIRERGEAAGAVGPVALLAEHRERIERLRARLGTEPLTRRLVMKQGFARMLLDDYLPTRLVEIVVHADDLAHSVGAEPVDFSDDVVDRVIDLLVATARHRHGDVAVIRALTRRERDDVEALRVF